MWTQRLLVALAVFLLVPLSASAAAAMVPFGGKIIAVEPCVSPAGALYVTIVPAGKHPINFIWTPATVTLGAGPPRSPGQNLLGRALPGQGFCIKSFFPFFALPGSLFMMMVGTSAM